MTSTRRRSRSRDYDRSRSPEYGRRRSRSRSRDYGRGRRRSNSLDDSTSISRSSSPDDSISQSSSPDDSTSTSRSSSPDYGRGRSPTIAVRGDSLTDDEEPISANRESWNISETAISGSLKDSQLLDCPICCLPLTPPVYQCTNGHISCESCCTKMSNECGTCHLPIGGGKNRCRAVEKILESFTITCSCKTSLTYNTKLDHDKTCRYAPCYCPFVDCTYVGLPKSVNTHFASQHSTSSEKFRFNRSIYTSLEKDQKHLFLLEEDAKTVFVVNRSIENYGSKVNVICIAPTSSEKQFAYVITPPDVVTKSKMKIQFVAENRPQWNQQVPPTDHVIVPNYWLTSTGRLDLKLAIFDD